MVLTEQERTDFSEKGFLGPYTLCSPDEMSEIRTKIDELIKTRQKKEDIASAVHPQAGDGEALRALYDAHHDDDTIFSLATHREIISRAQNLLGPDLLLWRSTFWIKVPGGRRLEWHQDTYKDEGFGSFPNLNAWIAIDEATEENCVQLVEGSHKEILDLDVFRSEAYVNALHGSDDLPPPPVSHEGRLVKMRLNPGQFFIFDGRILHGSRPNRLMTRRAGLTARFIPAGTRLNGLESEPVSLVNTC